MIILFRSIYVISALIAIAELFVHAAPVIAELTVATEATSEQSPSIAPRSYDTPVSSRRSAVLGSRQPPLVFDTVPTLSEQALQENNLNNAPAAVRGLDSSTPHDTGESGGDDDFYADLLDDFYEQLHAAEDQVDPSFVHRQEYLNQDGDQRPLEEISQRARDAIWASAGMTGRRIRKIVDKHVASGKSRIDLSSPKPQDMTQIYDSVTTDGIDLDYVFGQVDSRFSEAGLPAENSVFSETWTFAKVWSKGLANSESASPVLELGIQVKSRAIVSLAAFAKRDRNNRNDRLRSSELTWQTWTTTAREGASELDMAPDAAARSLKYVLRHTIVNQETQNIMDIAHTVGKDLHNADGTPCISDIPNGKDGKPLDPITGKGLWKPDNAIYNYLLSTPNIKPIAHMIADHCSEMDNPYIAEIHTFPSDRSFDVPETGRWGESPRSSAIVLVLGPKPASLETISPVLEVS